MSDMTVNNPGGVHGGFFGGNNNGSITVNGSSEPDPQPFFVRKRRLLPVTERGINLVAAVLTIATAFGLWRAAMQLWKNSPFSDAATRPASGDGVPLVGLDTQMVPVYVALGLAVCWATVMIVRRLIRSRTMGFSRFSFLPIVAGVTDTHGRGRLALLRLAGRCEKQLGRGRCGGKLRFHNKPTRWIDYTMSDGSTKREITERTPAAVCTRNRKHWYSVDEADVD